MPLVYSLSVEAEERLSGDIDIPLKQWALRGKPGLKLGEPVIPDGGQSPWAWGAALLRFMRSRETSTTHRVVRFSEPLDLNVLKTFSPDGIWLVSSTGTYPAVLMIVVHR